MAKSEAKKVLKRMENFLNSDQARKAIDKHKQRVWMYNADVAEAFKAGYNLVSNRRAKESDKKKDDAGLPPLDDSFFEDVAKQAIKAVFDYVDKPRTKAMLVTYTDTYISFDQDRYIAAPFTALKNKARSLINAKLKAEGKDILTRYRAESGKQGSESALFAQGTQRLHKTKRSVGALQLLAANEWASRSPTYNKFSSVKEIKSMVEALGQIELSFKKGNYKGADKVFFNPELQVSIFVGPHTDNPAGDLPTDWASIKPKLQEELEKFIVKEGITDLKGSNSIREDARKHARNKVISELKKKARVVSDSKPVVRKAETTKTNKRKPVGKKRKAYRNTVPFAAQKTSATKRDSSLYTVMALINDKLPETVRKNMGVPRLENQTGRFAQSVKMTDVIQTPQGFPSFGYTYRRDPYEVYETSSGSRLANIDRDPRNLIDASIREIAAGYALGRFYTRRV